MDGRAILLSWTAAVAGGGLGVGLLGRWRRRRSFGSYALEAILGQGAMGVVYRARHAATGRVVALKVLHPQWSEREELRLRFLREARMLTRVEHPNLVRVLEAGAVGDRGYLSMELLQGIPLSAYLARQGPLAPAIAIDLLLAACDALAYLHAAGLAHGSVRSANLFLLEPEDLARSVAEGWRPRIKLMDFGLAQSLGASGLDGPPDVRSDLYSLGVMAYEALTGHLPSADDPAGDVRRLAEVSPPLAERVEWLLAPSPRARPSSAAELAASLRALRGGDPAASLPAPAPPAGEADPEPPSAAVWQRLYQAARSGFAQARITEGQVLLVECLAELEDLLQGMAEDEREAYCRRHPEIAAAVELQRRWSRGSPSAPPRLRGPNQP